MTYTVKTYRTSKNPDAKIKWRVIVETWEGGERTDKQIPKDQLLVHGFNPTITADDARAIAAQKNAQNRLDGEKKRDDQKKHRALERAAISRTLTAAHLPAALTDAFEKDYLKAKTEGGPNEDYRYDKAVSYWRYARRMIHELNLKPSDWEDEARAFYNYFAKREISSSYASKVLWVTNLWGFFYSKKSGKPFLPIPFPRGHNLQRIRDAHRAAEKVSKESAPMMPEMLESAESSLDPAQYRWLFVSLWFGLRPKEVDSLKNPKNWSVFKQQSTDVLEIYQTKLSGVAHEERGKMIPVITPEQKKALRMIREGGLKRPLVKTIRKYVGEDVTNYGGRKAFTQVMQDHGQVLEDIAKWMGHASIERTWKSYRDKKAVRFKPIKKRRAA